MKKLLLATAISSIATSSAFAIQVFPYAGTAVSGTAANPLASIVVQAGAATSVFYVNSTSTASNINDAPVQLTVGSNWTFDWTNLNAVAFTGTIVYGNYKTQTSVTGTPTIDGRQTFVGGLQTVSGVGSYNEATNTFTFNYLNGTSNGGGASVQSETSSSCANGKTSALGKVCTSFTQASKAWEGLNLNFVFAENKGSFAGTLKATDTSGSGLTANTTTINWQISGVTTIPVPASAWLFGSGLVGLVGARRRAKKA